MGCNPASTKIKMKLHKDIKIELVASTDKTQTAILEPYLDITEGVGTLISTNGKTLARVPVEIDPTDQAGYVSKEAIKAARKTRLGEILLTDGKAAVSTGPTFNRTGAAGDCNFPNWRQVWPAADRVNVVTIGLDAKLLWELAQAMGTQCVKIQIADNKKPFLVSLTSGGQYSSAPRPVCDEARGIIMPVRVE